MVAFAFSTRFQLGAALALIALSSGACISATELTPPCQGDACGTEIEVPELKKHKLTVVVTSDRGKVVSTPAGIDCDRDNSPCVFDFAEGSKVHLKAEYDGDSSKFFQWSDCQTEGTPEIDVELSSDLRCSAIFSAAQQELSFERPNRWGMIEVKDGSATYVCSETSETCTWKFEEGAHVEIRAIAIDGGSFKQWGATDACQGSENVDFDMSSQKACTAVFGPPMYTMMLKPPVRGIITMSSDGTAMDCTPDSSECTRTVEYGSTIRLSAKGGQFGTELDTWLGDCANEFDASLDVPMHGNKTCGAEFYTLEGNIERADPETNSGQALRIHVSRERSNLRWPADTLIDTHVPSVTFTQSSTVVPAMIAPLAPVNVYLVHFDSNQRATATIKFERKVLGLIWRGSQLRTTDGMFARSGSSRQNFDAAGSLDSAGDMVRIADDRMSVTVALGSDIDQLRIITNANDGAIPFMASTNFKLLDPNVQRIDLVRNTLDDVTMSGGLYMFREKFVVNPSTMVCFDAVGAALYDAAGRHNPGGTITQWEPDCISANNKIFPSTKVNNRTAYIHFSGNTTVKSATGSITFEQPVWGISINGRRMRAADDVYGHPNVSYTPAVDFREYDWRGTINTTRWDKDKPAGRANGQQLFGADEIYMESGSDADTLTISPDGHTVTFSLNSTRIDDMRIVFMTP